MRHTLRHTRGFNLYLALDAIKEGLPVVPRSTIVFPGETEIRIHPRQVSGTPYPSGFQVHEWVKAEGLIELSLSIGHLKWFEENPSEIPAEFRGKWIYGWGSVRESDEGHLDDVAVLDCFVSRPVVYWHWLDNVWGHYEYAGLRRAA